jgi:hypothetical protein
LLALWIMKVRRVALLAALSLGTSCITEPDFLTDIRDIQAPASAAATDTLRISFRWTYGGCDVGVGVRTTSTPTQLTFAAFKRDAGIPGMGGTDVLHLQPYDHIVLPSQRSGTFTLVFRQPSGSDSVRVVVQQ